MEKDIYDDDHDTVSIITEQTFRPGKLEIAVCDGQTSSWYGNRAQVRSLIEALRQADAETRTEYEVIVRKRVDGCGIGAYGITPGEVHESCLTSWISNVRIDGVTREQAQAWWDEARAGLSMWRAFIDAPVTFIGFPDEPSE